MTVDDLILYYNIILWIIYLLGCSVGFSKKNQTFLAFLIIVSISLLMAMRGPETTIDTRNYNLGFIRASQYSSITEFYKNLTLGDEPILMSLFWVTSKLGDFSLALWLVSLISLSLVYRFCIKVDKYEKTHISSLILLIYLVSFYIAGQQYHIMRSGLALGFVLNGIIAIFGKRTIKAILWSVLAILTHFTALIPIAVAIISLRFKWKLKYYVGIFIFAILIAYLGFGFGNLGGLFLVDVAKVQRYLSGEDSVKYVLGFRLSFVVFNSIFLYIFIKKIYNANFLYNFLLRCYILLSAVLFLSFNVPYFDRIGAFSWNILPFLLIIGVVETYGNRSVKYAELAFIFMFMVKSGISFVSS